MRDFIVKRNAVSMTALPSEITSLRFAVGPAAAYCLVLFFLVAAILPSAQAQSSSGKVAARPAPVKAPSRPVPAQIIPPGDDSVPPPQATTTLEFVGSFHISDGAYWFAAPPCYTAREAAAQIFGGQATDYAISVNSSTTDSSTITHTAFLDGFGSTQFIANPQSEDFKSGTNYASGSFSALVHDHFVHRQGPINYVWRIAGTLPTPIVAGDVLISEFRFFGPLGVDDEYVELYNNTASQLVVSGNGWAVRTSDGVTRFIVPKGVIIPARGHYLAYGEPDYNNNRYSLQNYGGTNKAIGNINFQTDIPNTAGLALFSSTTTFDASTRIDSVGFTAVSDPLYFEGSRLTPPNGGTATTNENAFVRIMPAGRPQDSNNNAADFAMVSTTGNVGTTTTTLGAPGPETLSSPIDRSSQFSAGLLDPLQNSTSTPNRTRDLTSDPANCSTFGTMTVRRTFTNNTGATVTRLRFRIIAITSFPEPMGIADLRPRTIGDSNVTVTGGGSVLVRGPALETPPNQPACGGLNTSLTLPSVTATGPVTSVLRSKVLAVRLSANSDTIDVDAPLANGASINVQFLFGVQQTGRYRFFVNVEALP